MTQVTPNASTVNAGAQLSVTNATQNTSSAKSGTLKIAFRLSINTIYGDSDDVTISTTRTVSSLIAGATNSATTNVTIPSTTLAGVYYVCAKTDSQSQVVEGNENNNTLCSSSQVTVPADLTMIALSTTTTTIAAGTNLVADNTAKNLSGAKAGAFVVGFHLSTDQVYGGADDVAFSTTRSISSLAIGATSAASTTLTVPTTTPAGTYYLCAMADSAAVVPESNETNNALCTTTTLAVTRPAIIGLSLSEGPVGTPVTITGSNFGATQGTSIVTFNGVNATPTTWSASSISTTVPAGATTGSVVVTVNGAASNGINFLVGSPDLTVSDVSTTSGTVPAGSSLLLNNTVNNPDVASAVASVTAFSLSPDATYGGIGDIQFTNTQSVPSLNGGGNNVASTRLIVPSTTPAANYYLCAGADSASQVTESNETNNTGCTASTIAITAGNLITYVYDELGRLTAVTDPASDSATYIYDAVGNLLSITRQGFTTVTILEFTPNNGPVGTAVTIFGSGFSATPSQNTVMFNGVTATVTFSSATQIATSVPAGATTGSVTVTSPSGSAASSTPFTVTASNSPTISGFTPVTGPQATAVTINGTNFETILANNNVTLNTSIANLTSGTATSLSTTVPISTASGKISVATPFGTATSATDFFVTPLPYLTTDQEVMTRISIGQSSPITINTVGKIALVVFDGTAGQQINLQISSVTVPSSAVSILNPDGTQFLLPVKVTTSGANLGPYILPATGTYTILVSLNDVISTIAGTGLEVFLWLGNGIPATDANLWPTTGVTADSVGNIYLSETIGTWTWVRKIDGNGIINMFAGTGTPGYGGDGGPAVEALLSSPRGLAVDTQGNVFIATGNHCIRKVDTSNIITTVAGICLSPGYSGDGGPATSAQLFTPYEVAIDTPGNIFIADFSNHRIRKVATNGIITTVAGNGTAGYSGDGGPATSAKLYHPGGVAIDSLGNIYIADQYNHRIRKVDTSGIITTFAGNGLGGDTGDGGPATSAQVGSPLSVVVDPQGNFYITHSCRVRMVNTAGTITTIAGSSTCGSSGDNGPARRATMTGVAQIALDSQGNLLLADEANLKVRKIVRGEPATGGSMTITVTNP